MHHLFHMCVMFRDEDLHMTMQIPVLHAIESYVPGGPLSGINQYVTMEGIRRHSQGHGYPAASTTTSTATTTCKSGQWKQHKLDKVTEEERNRNRLLRVPPLFLP